MEDEYYGDSLSRFNRPSLVKIRDYSGGSELERCYKEVRCSHNLGTRSLVMRHSF